MFAQIQKYTKNQWILYFKWVKFMVCDLYLNKAVIVKKINGASATCKTSNIFKNECKYETNKDLLLVQRTIFNTF